MPHQTTVAYLKEGDRFYFTTCKKKEVWQVTSYQYHLIKVKGFTLKARLVHKAIGNSISTIKKSTLETTNVVLLRNIYEQQRPEAGLFI